MGVAELEINDHDAAAVGADHHAVGATRLGQAVLDGEDGALVEERPLTAEPRRHERVLKAAGEPPLEVGARHGHVAAVCGVAGDDALVLEGVEDAGDVGARGHLLEDAVQEAPHLDVLLAARLLGASEFLGIVAEGGHELLGAVALAEGGAEGVAGHGDVEGLEDGRHAVVVLLFDLLREHGLAHLSPRGEHRRDQVADGAAPALEGIAAAAGPGVEVALRAREGHVERIQLVEARQEVGLGIVAGEGGVGSRGGVGRDGQQLEAVEGSLRGRAPQEIRGAVTVDGPAAEGHEDGVELEALSLVDGDDADALDLPGGDGLAGEALVPVAEEGVDVRRLGVEEVQHRIEEAEEIGILAGEAVKAEVAVEGLQKLVERQLAQRDVEALGGQLGHLGAEVEGGDGILRIVERAERRDERGHGGTRREQEGLVADDGRHVRLGGEALDDRLHVAVVAYEDGHPLIGHPLGVEVADASFQVVEDDGLPVLAPLVVLGGEDGDADVAAVGALRGHVLMDVTIDLLEGEGAAHGDDVVARDRLEGLHGLFEEFVVEVDDMARTAAVDVEGFDVDAQRRLPLDVAEDAPVAAAPTVDALLHVADEEVAAALGEALEEEHAEVLPLQSRGVLKLVDHDMAQQGADLLEDERRVAVAHHATEEDGRLGEVEAGGLGIDVGHLAVDGVEEAEGLEMRLCQTGAVDLVLEAAQLGDGVVEGSADVVSHVEQLGAASLVGLLDERHRVGGPALDAGAGRHADIAPLEALHEGAQVIAVGEVGEGAARVIDGALDLGAQRLDGLGSRGLHLLHLADEGAHEGGVVQDLAQLVAPQEIVLVEDGAAEVLHLARHVPPLVARDAVAHKAVEPLEDLRLVLQAVHDAIDGLREHLGVADLHLQVRRQPQLVSQAAEDGLEESIDGLHAETVVVVQDLVQRHTAAAPHLLVGESRRSAPGVSWGLLLQGLAEGAEIRLAAGQAVADAVELAEDAVLHLGRGLVGEGDGQDAGILARLLGQDQQLHVVHSQRERLAGAGRSFINGER